MASAGLPQGRSPWLFLKAQEILGANVLTAHSTNTCLPTCGLPLPMRKAGVPQLCIDWTLVCRGTRWDGEVSGMEAGPGLLGALKLQAPVNWTAEAHTSGWFSHTRVAQARAHPKSKEIM